MALLLAEGRGVRLGLGSMEEPPHLPANASGLRGPFGQVSEVRWLALLTCFGSRLMLQTRLSTRTASGIYVNKWCAKWDKCC